jgi:hypothetical protein
VSQSVLPCIPGTRSSRAQYVSAEVKRSLHALRCVACCWMSLPPPLTSLPPPACLPPAATALCEGPTSCPEYGPHYYCTSGLAVNGCRTTSASPFPTDKIVTDTGEEAVCTQQCLTAYPAPWILRFSASHQWAGVASSAGGTKVQFVVA